MSKLPEQRPLDDVPARTDQALALLLAHQLQARKQSILKARPQTNDKLPYFLDGLLPLALNTHFKAMSDKVTMSQSLTVLQNSTGAGTRIKIRFQMFNVSDSVRI